MAASPSGSSHGPPATATGAAPAQSAVLASPRGTTRGALRRQRIKRHLLQPPRKRRLNMQRGGRSLAAPQTARVFAREIPKDHQRLEIIAVSAGMVVIRCPQVDLALRCWLVGIRGREA